MVEGGAVINSLFLDAGLVDELRVAIAPFFVGESGSVRPVAGAADGGDRRELTLKKLERAGEMLIAWYAPRPQ